MERYISSISSRRRRRAVADHTSGPSNLSPERCFFCSSFPIFPALGGEGDNEFLEFPATRFTANMLCNLLIQDLSGV